eukprot:698698-Prymnesium_polylepis.2
MSYEQTQTLTILDVADGGEGESSTISALRDGKPLVLDFWHTKCQNCPAALAKLDKVAASGKHADVKFVACALSLCDKPDGPPDEDSSKEGVTELIDDMWDSLTHCYMTADEKAKAKAEFGFTSVPFCVVYGADGALRFKGNPADIDYATVFAAPAPVEEATKAIAKVDLKPLGEANHEAAAAKPVLGFGGDDEDF